MNEYIFNSDCVDQEALTTDNAAKCYTCGLIDWSYVVQPILPKDNGQELVENLHNKNASQTKGLKSWRNNCNVSTGTTLLVDGGIIILGLGGCLFIQVLGVTRKVYDLCSVVLCCVLSSRLGDINIQGLSTTFQLKY